MPSPTEQAVVAFFFANREARKREKAAAVPAPAVERMAAQIVRRVLLSARVERAAERDAYERGLGE